MNKKELIITDLMDSPIRDSSGLDYIKKRVRNLWHKSLPRDMLRHVSRGGIRFSLDATSHFGLKILKDGYFNPDKLLYLFNATRRQGADIFLDIGAHVGYYSLLATKTSDFREIHAIEAHPENYRRLLMQIEANAFQNIITPYNIAASERGRELYIDRRTTVLQSVSMYKRQNDITIKAMALDSMFNFVGRNIAIKIDVEGHEVEAFKGMVNLLSRNKVLLQVEILSHNIDTFYYLHNNGYRCIFYMGDDFYFIDDKEQKQYYL